MKKILFAFVFIFISTALIAQNTGIINQYGTSNESTVEQLGSNTATVDQFGTNLAEVNQNGFGNTADVDQGTALNSRSNNHIPNYSTDHEWGVWVDQIGNDNQAVVNQQGNSGSAAIYQDGNLNEAYQEINTFASGATANTRKGLDIYQDGIENWANQKTVASFGSYGIKKMYVDQIGNDNFADQYSKGGMSSVVEIKQVGSNNDYNVDLTLTGLTSPLNLPFADKPTGDYAQYQNGRFSTASIDILGSDNHTAQYQEYTVWSTSGANYAELDIIGDHNNVAQGQIGESNNSTLYLSGDGNVVSTSQFGDGNIADIDILGLDNVSAIQQTGDSNNGSITQTGNDNFGTITSVGNGHTGTITQTGGMNQAVITQSN